MTALLTIDDAAHLLRVSTRTIRRAINDGGLRAFQVAGRGTWRIHPDDLDAWLEQRATGPRDRAPATAPALAVVGRARTRRQRATHALAVTADMGRTA